MEKQIEVEAVSFILISDSSILVEQRSLSKATDPGIISIPGGHVEPNESLEEACKREMFEELDLKGYQYTEIDIVEHVTPKEIQTIHYFKCNDWSGEIVVNEADIVFWLPFSKIDDIHYDFERKILQDIIDSEKV
jgi:8-oxo-dGTP diphosphatase